MKRWKFDILLSIVMVLLFTVSCGRAGTEQDGGGDSSAQMDMYALLEQNTEAYNPDRPLTIKNLAFMVVYGGIQTEHTCYLYFVQLDGSIYSAIYKYQDEKKEGFFSMIGQGDDKCFDYLDQIEYLGRLSDEQTSQLIDYYVSIDLHSDYYDVNKESEATPDVIRTWWRDEIAYVFTEDGGKQEFLIQWLNGEQGVFRETYDENALAMRDLICKDSTFLEWKEGLKLKFGHWVAENY